MSIHMPYSPLDALLNCRADVRKAGRVKPGDTCMTVDARVADVFRPIVIRIQQEAIANAKAVNEQAVMEIAHSMNRFMENKPDVDGRYVHNVTCSGDRKKPAGSRMSCCSCGVVPRDTLKKVEQALANFANPDNWVGAIWAGKRDPIEFAQSILDGEE